MLTKSEKTFTIIFAIIVIAELICDNTQSLTTWHYVTKPAIVISLIFFFWKQSDHLKNKTRLTTLLALVFSLMGDILLMFVDMNTNFFITGLLSFLIAHIMYILIFSKKRNSNKRATLFIGFLLVFASGLFYFLKDGLGDLLLPVIIYMLVILLMVVMAFLRNGSVPKTSYVLVFVGALFFITSDSLLALNKFHNSLPLSSISIMLTYSIAQFLIVLGLKKQQ